MLWLKRRFSEWPLIKNAYSQPYHSNSHTSVLVHTILTLLHMYDCAKRKQTAGCHLIQVDSLNMPSDPLHTDKNV